MTTNGLFAAGGWSKVDGDANSGRAGCGLIKVLSGREAGARLGKPCHFQDAEVSNWLAEPSTFDLQSHGIEKFGHVLMVKQTGQVLLDCKTSQGHSDAYLMAGFPLTGAAFGIEAGTWHKSIQIDCTNLWCRCCYEASKEIVHWQQS